MNSEIPTEAIYSGEFPRTLDAKHRLTIPAGWVGQGETEFQIVMSANPAQPFLIAIQPGEFAVMEKRIQALQKTENEKRMAIRSFYSAARAVSSDKQGRILLPEDHCSKAQLKTDVVLIGCKSRFEIWDAGLWNQAQEAATPNWASIATDLGLF